MRSYDCYIYHLQDKKLVQNGNCSCWAGLNRETFTDRKYDNIILDIETKDNIFIDQYIQPEITDDQRKRIVYLINKITPCKFEKIDNKIYIKYKLLKNHYSNLLLFNFIRILWYQNRSFNNEKFFIDICKSKTRGLDYLEFMMTCIKDNVLTENNAHFGYGDHSFVYANIIPKTKEMLLKYTGKSMSKFLQHKIEDIK